MVHTPLSARLEPYIEDSAKIPGKIREVRDGPGHAGSGIFRRIIGYQQFLAGFDRIAFLEGRLSDAAQVPFHQKRDPLGGGDLFKG